YPVDALEASFLFAAKRLCIRTVGHLMSWDNITSKGRFPVIPDVFISWGPIMTAEIQQYYGTPRDRIHECAVAHFDAHTRAGSAGPAAQPYLFFGMGAEPRKASIGSEPREIDIVEWLAEAVRRGTFGERMRLV